MSYSLKIVKPDGVSSSTSTSYSTDKEEVFIHGLVEGYRQKLNGDESTVERLFDLVQEKALIVYGTTFDNILSNKIEYSFGVPVANPRTIFSLKKFDFSSSSWFSKL